MLRFRNSLMAAVAVAMLSLVGCKERLKDPELADPIYLDLRKEEASYKKAAEDAKKTFEQFDKQISSLEPRSLELKQARKDKEKQVAIYEHSSQLGQYFEIRANKRRLESRVLYQTAFDKDEPWPPRGEFEAYQTNQRLRNAPRNWDTRVPSLTSRYLASDSSKDQKKEKKEKTEESAKSEEKE